MDKEREALDGHDGTWVAHPGLVPVAMEVFNHIMKTPNQIFRKREEIYITEKDLLEVPMGTITEEGLRMNISVGIQYIASWLSGRGAAPIYNLMEDAATAEISRAQVWQWIRHEGGKLHDGRNITFALVEALKAEELAKIEREIGKEQFENGRFIEATKLFTHFIRSDEFETFLTLPGYEIL
jgi:malate synthase